MLRDLIPLAVSIIIIINTKYMIERRERKHSSTYEEWKAVSAPTR